MSQRNFLETTGVASGSSERLLLWIALQRSEMDVGPFGALPWSWTCCPVPLIWSADANGLLCPNSAVHCSMSYKYRIPDWKRLGVLEQMQISYSNGYKSDEFADSTKGTQTRHYVISMPTGSGCSQHQGEIRTSLFRWGHSFSCFAGLN